MEACVGAHHLNRKLNSLGHDTRLMPSPAAHAKAKTERIANSGPTNFRPFGSHAQSLHIQPVEALWFE
jgi:hypothetical protein